MLIMITGLPGSGKTTISIVLAKYLDAVHLNTDIIQTRMGKRGVNDDNSLSVRYAKMLKQTESNLHKGKSVIVDAIFCKRALRTPYVQLAKKYKKSLFWILVVAREDTIKERMQLSAFYNDKDFKQYKLIKSIYEPLAETYFELHSDDYTTEEIIIKVKGYLQLTPFQASVC